MKNQLLSVSFTIAVASLNCLSAFQPTNAQSVYRTSSGPVINNSLSKPKPVSITAEERLIRETYEKLVRLNQGAPIELKAAVGIKQEDTVLQFALSDFKVGPIQDIIATRAADIVSLPGGEVVVLSRVVSSRNGKDSSVSYKAQWTPGQYASVFEPNWTVGQLLNFEADKTYDVGEYASYVVKLAFQGKTKTYKALALFHNAHRFQGNLRPTFWDGIVGTGGTLTDAWNELRPISESLSSPQSRTVSGVIEPLGSQGSIVRRKTEDSKEHQTGVHGEEVGMQGTCFDERDNQQRCQVAITDSFTYERGELTNIFFFHSNKVEEKLESSTGGRNVKIDCYGARGIATGNCSFFGCGFTAGLQGSGASVHMTGGDVWNGQVVLTHTCGVGATAGGSCTTPSFDGSCPPGSSPNGTGLCCFSGGQSCGSLTFINKCYMYGGDYDFLSCTCLGCDVCGGSPVVLDIDGDGISLTGPNEGVEFDLNGNGTKDSLGWTKPNSDDAWLVLDRNGNGNIDNGTELFGDFTPQPAGPDKNGFLALAVFDQQANGGNGDGVIDPQDSVFTNLRLWQDKNHNGSVDEGELHTLAALNVKAIELDFKESKKLDQYGNEFRYRAKVKDSSAGSVGRWAWDVFLSHPTMTP